ncbi:MAG: HAD-IA family hydrolase [Clostridia bacterium]|nr:HAD-IA family hydrolase [Clostridia bacterium]
MKDTNKIVIFDWGGVIENNNPEEYTINKAIIDIMRKYNCNLSNEEIFNICSNGKNLYNTFINDDEEITKKWFKEVKNKLNISCTYEEYKKSYYEYGKKIPYHRNVVRYSHDLNKKCKTAVFSSLVKLDYQRINDQVNLSKFDYVFLTYRMGYNKPNEKTFEIIEKQTRIKPENMLFIDDTKVNIDVAQKRGWNTCNANGYELDKIKKTVKIFLH